MFMDLGNAWDNQLRDLLGSAGLGVRLRVGGFLLLRYDFGKRFTWSNVDDKLSLRNLKLHTPTRHQFFFGWDF
jgi:hypothetical protein